MLRKTITGIEIFDFKNVVILKTGLGVRSFRGKFMDMSPFDRAHMTSYVDVL